MMAAAWPRNRGTEARQFRRKQQRELIGAAVSFAVAIGLVVLLSIGGAP